LSFTDKKSIPLTYVEYSCGSICLEEGIKFTLDAFDDVVVSEDHDDNWVEFCYIWQIIFQMQIGAEFIL